MSFSFNPVMSSAMSALHAADSAALQHRGSGDPMFVGVYTRPAGSTPPEFRRRLSSDAVAGLPSDSPTMCLRQFGGDAMADSPVIPMTRTLLPSPPTMFKSFDDGTARGSCAQHSVDGGHASPPIKRSRRLSLVASMLAQQEYDLTTTQPMSMMKLEPQQQQQQQQQQIAHVVNYNTQHTQQQNVPMLSGDYFPSQEQQEQQQQQQWMLPVSNVFQSSSSSVDYESEESDEGVMQLASSSSTSSSSSLSLDGDDSEEEDHDHNHDHDHDDDDMSESSDEYDESMDAAPSLTMSFTTATKSRGRKGSDGGSGGRKAPKRVDRACGHCKRSKTRCDKMRPCARCVRTGKAESCVDAVHKKRGRKRTRFPSSS